MRCQKCGNDNKEDSVFCANCGVKLDAASPAQDETSLEDSLDAFWIPTVETDSEDATSSTPLSNQPFEDGLPFGETTGEIPVIDEPTAPQARRVAAAAEQTGRINSVPQVEHPVAFGMRPAIASSVQPKRASWNAVSMQDSLADVTPVQDSSAEAVLAQDDSANTDPVGQPDTADAKQGPSGEQIPVQQPYYVQQAFPSQPYAQSYMHKPPSQSHAAAGQRYVAKGPLKRSWIALIKNPDWFMRVAMLGLVMLIPIFGPIVVMGYVYTQARGAAFGVENPLPEQVISERTVRSGVRVFVVSLVLGVILSALLQLLSGIPYIGAVLSVVVACLISPVLAACCFRAAVCEKTASGFNFQYVFRLLKNRYGKALGVVVLPSLLASAVALAFTFIWCLISIVMIGTSLSSITMFRYNWAEQLAAISPGIYIVSLILLFIVLWAIFVATASAMLVYTRAFAYLCAPLDAPLWPDFESAWVPTMASDTIDPDSSHATSPKSSKPGQAVWSNRPTTESYVQSQPTMQMSPVAMDDSTQQVPIVSSDSTVHMTPVSSETTDPIAAAVEEGPVSVGATARIALLDTTTGATVPVGRFPFAIGSGKGASLQLADDGIGKGIQAYLTDTAAGAYEIRVTGAGGLTFVNGFDMAENEKRELADGDVLAFGKAEYAFKIL